MIVMNNGQYCTKSTVLSQPKYNYEHICSSLDLTSVTVTCSQIHYVNSRSTVSRQWCCTVMNYCIGGDDLPWAAEFNSNSANTFQVLFPLHKLLWMLVPGEVFRTRPDKDWVTPTSYTTNTGYFRTVQRPGRSFDHQPPSSAVVKEGVELHIYYPPYPCAFVYCSRVNFYLYLYINYFFV